MGRGDWPRFGLVTRDRAHVGLARLVFWETKDVGGAERAPLAGAVACVSLFADNRVARQRPEWVQVGTDGVRAERGAAPYFDWAHLCPSRPEVAALALAWVERAAAGGGDVRVSDAGFARDGHCRCDRCLAAAASRRLDLGAYRLARTAELLAAVRERVPGRLFLTLYPDPYPGHLERRFGLHPTAAAAGADAYVVPLYDLAYATTHWLETLCLGFADRLAGRPWYAELYGLGVGEEHLARALRVAARYATGVVVAYDRDAARIARLRALVESGAAGDPPDALA
jgi:hypothetical protein